MDGYSIYEEWKPQGRQGSFKRGTGRLKIWLRTKKQDEDKFLRYLTILFHMQRLQCIVTRDGNTILNDEVVTIWKGQAVTYFRVLPRNWPGMT